MRNQPNPTGVCCEPRAPLMLVRRHAWILTLALFAILGVPSSIYWVMSLDNPEFQLTPRLENLFKSHGVPPNEAEFSFVCNLGARPPHQINKTISIAGKRELYGIIGGAKYIAIQLGAAFRHVPKANGVEEIVLSNNYQIVTIDLKLLGTK